MVHTGLTTFYSRTFPGLFNNMQGVRFHRHTITYFPQSLQKKNEDNVTGCPPPILLLFLCFSLFMCDFNADSPMFEMSIIRSQHLQKAFFLSPLNAVTQPLYWELSSHCRL